MSTVETRATLPTIRAGGKAASIIPQSFEEVQRFAEMAVRSELFKKAKDDESDETTLARCSLAILTGLDCGLSPAQSVQSIAVINGRCLIYGDAVPGILWANGFDIEQSISGEGDARTATCAITRPNGKKITRTFSVADAKKARLWDEREKVRRRGRNGEYEAQNDSPWFRFPDRMLGWRALGFAKSDGASDVMRGLDIKENIDPVDLSRDEYSEIKVEPKKAIADLPDIPDEPDKKADISGLPEGENAQLGLAKLETGKPDKKAVMSDQQFIDALDGAYATANDLDALNEHLAANEIEIEERGLEQACADVYKRHMSRIYDRM